jgi:hypothetical protein
VALVGARTFCEQCDRLTWAARHNGDWPALAAALLSEAGELRERIRRAAGTN